jgi:hypothetical protein
MSNDSRFKSLAGAFRLMPRELCGLTVRPITAGSLDLLYLTGNMLFSADAPAKAGSEIAAIAEFLWIHTAPLEEVLDAAEDPALFRRKTRAFALQVDIDDLGKITAAISAAGEQIAAATVEPEAPEGSGETAGEPSPTGLQASSTISAPIAIPSASATSSGSSLSLVPANTSTRPIETPAASAPGQTNPAELLTTIPARPLTASDSAT